MPSLKTTTSKKSTVTTLTDNSVKTTNTRNKQSLPIVLKKENAKDFGSLPKRKASPIKGNTLKRSALGNITNAIETQCVITSGKKSVKKAVSSTVTKPTIATAAKISLPPTTLTRQSIKSSVPIQPNASKSMLPPLPKSRLTLPPSKPLSVSQSKLSLSSTSLKSVAPTVALASAVRPVTRQSPAAAKKPTPAHLVPVSKCKLTVKPKGTVSNIPVTRRSSTRRSTLDSTDSSLYISALSDVLDDDTNVSAQPEPLPEPEINIDEEYSNDPHQCAIYAHEIFEYLKSREEHFKIEDYMQMQKGLNQQVRAVLVDWMVEIQENFELNHETLYLGVKLVDAYLSKIKVGRQSLQLLGVTAMFIAAKYDERIPPAIADFLYVCDGLYQHRDVTKMEVNILKVMKFELGFPLSYRFLRRYARCAKVPMPLLTLARYILEFTLMDYTIVSLSDSKTAAAALYLAFKMKKEQEWDNTLIHFSGYRVRDFIEIAHLLNNILHQKPRQTLSTVRNKYSHKIFFEVAKIPLVSNEDL